MHRCTAGTHVARARARSAESDTRDATTPVCSRQGDLTQMRGRTSAMGAGAAPASHLTPRDPDPLNRQHHRCIDPRNTAIESLALLAMLIAVAAATAAATAAAAAAAAAATAAAVPLPLPPLLLPHMHAQSTPHNTHAHTHARTGTCTHAHAQAQGQCRPQIWRL